MQRLRVLIAVLALTACAGEPEETGARDAQVAEMNRSDSPSAAPAAATHPADPSNVPGEVRGQPVASRIVSVLHPGTNTVEALDLGLLLGKQPISICYTLLGEPIGEEALKRFQELATAQSESQSLRERIEFMGAIRVGKKFTVETASERLNELGVSMPVILEERLDLGRSLGATAAPSISLIDKQGVLRVADARNLKQEITEEKSVADALWHVARGGKMPTVMRMRRYYPANDHKGNPAPDFTLTRFRGTEKVSLSEHIVDDKVTALLFWHPNCKQCKTVMPSIIAGYRTFSSYINMVSVVNLKDEFEERNCAIAIDGLGITWPVLVDEAKEVTNRYFIVSTPTMIFIKPDGIVDSVYTSGSANYLPIMKARLEAILGTSSQQGAEKLP